MLQQTSIPKTIKTGYTHNGLFHADDVFTAALLKLMLPDIVFIRCERDELPEGDITNDHIVFDIGGGRFDHHDGAEEVLHRNGTSYASFGKVISVFITPLLNSIHQNAGNRFLDGFAEMVDKWDTDPGDKRATVVPLLQAIEQLNPTWYETYGLTFEDITNEFNTAFDVAVQAAIPHVISRLLVVLSPRPDNILKKLPNECKTKHYIILKNGFVPLGGYASTHTSLKWAIVPSKRIAGHYDLIAVNNPEKSENGANAPKRRAHLTDIQYVSLCGGIYGCVFVHPDKFMATFSSYENVMRFVNERLFKR